MTVNKTRFMSFPRLNDALGVEVVLISELQQKTHSFKFRAAWNVVSSVDAPHFLAASSGNFGQALACASQLKGKGCTIVMPANSAKVKIAAVRSYGAKVVLVDTQKVSRAQKVAEIAKANPQYYVASAYDCHHVIQGNSSLGTEIAASEFDFDTVISPVGGGGLSSGVILGLQNAGCHIAVVGAEPEMANDASLSLQQGVLVANQFEPQTIADGARTVSLGKKNWAIIKEHLSRIIEVPEWAIRKAMVLLSEVGIRVEPTGAVSVGSLLVDSGFGGQVTGCILSGGNVDPELYDYLISSDNN